jgi:hypothetical protein
MIPAQSAGCGRHGSEAVEFFLYHQLLETEEHNWDWPSKGPSRVREEAAGLCLVV